MKRCHYYISLGILLFRALSLYGAEQSNDYETTAAIKTNLLSDVHATPNIGIELKLDSLWTVDLSGEFNNWTFNGKKWKHWTIQPEMRYWIKESFHKFFVGFHVLGGEFNIGNWGYKLPFFRRDLYHADDYRYQGYFLGAGIGYGYAWSINRNWGLSAELGLGYIYSKSDKFACENCKKKLDENIDNHYFGPTKAAVNLIYKFTKDKPQPIVEEPEPIVIPECPAFAPQYLFIRPDAEVVKERSLSGQAFIEFEVNKTDIQANRANNRTELDKILASIDSVRNNPDTEIKALSIKGYASPDGPYDKNAELAKGRTQRLSEYVRGLYKFDKSIMHTSSEPEDWEGFRTLVGASTLPHRNEILEIANSSLMPDTKEKQIKERFPKDYDIMRNDILMRLRHSDYKIEYKIRSYTSPEEIREVLLKRPSNLSLEEFYVAAQGYDVNSEEFDNVFLTAVQFYPNDAVANINAANIQMDEGNLPQAKRYLERAGQSPAANYARGIYYALSKDYTTSLEYLKDAQANGIANASAAIQQVTAIQEWEETWGKQ